jgi:hypothetical protein
VFSFFYGSKILKEDKEVDTEIQSLIDNPWQGLLEDDES